MRDPAVGETFTAVVVHPNKGQDRDPVAKVNNKTTFVRWPKKECDDVEFGDVYLARMADKRENHNLAVVVKKIE